MEKNAVRSSVGAHPYVRPTILGRGWHGGGHTGPPLQGLVPRAHRTTLLQWLFPGAHCLSSVFRQGQVLWGQTTPKVNDGKLPARLLYGFHNSEKPKILIERSLTAFHSSHSILALVGNLINGDTSLCERLEKEVPRQPRALHKDVVKTYFGVLCLGKSDFEAAEGFTDDDWFKKALGIRKMFSEKKLPQTPRPATPSFLSPSLDSTPRNCLR